MTAALAAALAPVLVGSPAMAQTAPDAPIITSEDFPGGSSPSDGEPTPMLGEVGTLTITTTDLDTEYYLVDFYQDDAGRKKITLDSPGEPVTLEYMPTIAGSQVLTVRAVNTAGYSVTTRYIFHVSASDPVGSWNLDEPAGSSTVTDADGGNRGRVGAGVMLGADGPGESTAASFDGSEDAYIDTADKALLPTDEGFAAAAWVRVDDLSRDQAAVSLNGSGESGFILGYHSLSETSGEWMMRIPDAAHDATGAWLVSGGSARPGTADEWVHLLGVYDARDQSMTLYVNGVEAATGTRETVWSAEKDVQIGRAFEGGEYGLHWSGDLAEAKVFDRVVPPGEVSDLIAYSHLNREGYWQFNTAENGQSPEYLGGEAAQLGGDAEIYTQTDIWFDPPALNGEGHLALDGDGDYASLSSPMVDTSGSFSLTVRALIDDRNAATDMTVLSIPGTHQNMVEVRYSAESHAWELVLATADTPDSEKVSVTGRIGPSEWNGQGLAVVFNGALGEWTLYVNGAASEPLSDSGIEPWTAEGGIQIGRSWVDGVGDSYFAGAIDEVRAYTGVLSEYQVWAASTPGEFPGF